MSAPPSGRQFEIAAGRLRATVVEVGGGIRRLRLDDRDLLDGYPRHERCSGARGTPLIPWPNRLADGRYSFGGREHQVALTEPQAHNAIHGFLRWRNWTAREQRPGGVVMGTVLHPLSGYPFMLDVTVTYTLSEGPANGAPTPPGLRVTTTVTNLGDTACPYGSGQHPYLTAGTDLIDECTLELDAASWIPTDERGLPTGQEPVAGSPHDYRTGRRLDQARLDNTFTGLARDPAGLAWVRLTAPDGRTTALWVDEHYPFVEIYTGDTQAADKRRRGLGVEPMTCAPNAFRSGVGLIELQPGQSATSSWGVTVPTA